MRSGRGNKQREMKLKNQRSKFPKQLPPISKQDLDICDDFMKIWHERLDGDKRYSLIESFNHTYSTKSYHYTKLRGGNTLRHWN